MEDGVGENPAGELTVVLDTERLSLAPHTRADFAGCAALWGDPAVTRYIGGRAFTAEESWARVLRYAGHWALLGFGYWAIRERGTGAFVGEVGFADHRRGLDPPFGDDPEIGWALAVAGQGRGLAREAVHAVLKWGDARFTRRTVCMIHPENARSLRLAGEMGYVAYAEARYRDAPTVLLARAG